jgi:hypothetical protein
MKDLKCLCPSSSSRHQLWCFRHTAVPAVVVVAMVATAEPAAAVVAATAVTEVDADSVVATEVEADSVATAADLAVVVARVARDAILQHGADK